MKDCAFCGQPTDKSNSCCASCQPRIRQIEDEADMVWIVGKVLDADNNRWEFQGVFTEEKLAVGACRDEKFFVGPMVLDQELPYESVMWPGAYYPVKGGAK